MRFAPHLVCLGLALLAPFACSSTPTTATAIVRPQLVAVDPNDFLGSVHCAPPVAGDAAVDQLEFARSYVATLFDVTPDADGGVPNPGTPLASSPPTTCLQQVTFSYVTAGHRYVAEVDAYEQGPDELTPISAGSRLLSNPDGSRALPRWLATCGTYPPSPAIEAGTDSAGASGVDEESRPPGVVSYSAVTQIPHDCGQGLRAPD
jgi:hypothetical protein